MCDENVSNVIYDLLFYFLICVSCCNEVQNMCKYPVFLLGLIQFMFSSQSF